MKDRLGLAFFTFAAVISGSGSLGAAVDPGLAGNVA